MASCNKLPIDLNTLADELKQRLFVKVTHYRGWKLDLLIDRLSVREEILLICYVCHGVMRDAVNIDSHTSCKVCVRTGMHNSASENTNARSIIKELQIKCPLTLSEEGCDWTGAIANLTTHFPSCLYYPVLCPLECTVMDNNTAEPVITTLPRHKVESHVTETCPNRQINCEFCNAPIKAVEMNFHVSECEAFPLACPNNCINPHNNEPTLVMRGKMNNHIEIVCANVELDCPYLSHGCNVKLLRKDLATHEQDFLPQHLRLMKTKLAEKDNMISSLKNICEIELSYIKHKIERIDTQSEEFRNLIENQDKLIKQTENLVVTQQLKCFNIIEWTIEDVRDCIRYKEVLTSDMFYACQCKFYCTAGFRQYSNNSMSFFISITHGEFDNYLSWPLIASCKYILLNLDNPNDHYVREMQNQFNKPLIPNPYTVSPMLTLYGFTKFVKLSRLTREGKYRQNDSITLRVEIRSISKLIAIC